MSDFRRALQTIFLHEGRHVDHPSDPGGSTDWGISLRFLMQTGDLDRDGWRDGDINHDGEINVMDLRSLSREDAENLYRIYFWERNRYEKITSQVIATKIFDLAVNMGSHAAHLVAQRAIRSAIGMRMTEDGILGPKSLSAINMINPLSLMPAIKSEAAGYYRSIRYKNSRDFLNGWLNRAYSDPILSLQNPGSE